MSDATLKEHEESKNDQQELRRQELELERTKLFIDFAKFGFGGTLTAAMGGRYWSLAYGS
jgi:hypothetical protein